MHLTVWTYEGPPHIGAMREHGLETQPPVIIQATTQPRNGQSEFEAARQVPGSYADKAGR